MLYHIMGWTKSSKTKDNKKKQYSKKKTESALAVAKKALKLATQNSNATTELKYLSFSDSLDLANNAAGVIGAAVFRDCVNTASTIPLFNADGLTGNKAFLKYIKGTWEINMNNEEESVNFTVAVFKLKSDSDVPVQTGTLGNYVSVVQGQTYFDPRHIKVLYYKHFAMYGGGNLSGDRSGAPIVKTGHFYIPVNKMIRLSQQGLPGQQTASAPQSYQDSVFFTVFTDNITLDLENPRINYRLLSVYRDNDINY